MDPDPAIFVRPPVTFKTSTKNNFFPSFFLLITLEGTFTSFFKYKKSYRSHKTVGINVILNIFAWVIEGSGSGFGSVGPDADPGGPKTHGSYGSESATLNTAPLYSLFCLGGENVGSGDGKALHVHWGNSRLQRSLPLQTVRTALPGQWTA